MSARPPRRARRSPAAASPSVSRAWTRCWVASQTVSRLSVAGPSRREYSSRARSRTCPRDADDDAGLDEPVDRAVLRLRRASASRTPLAVAELLEPGDRPAGVGVELVLLLGEDLGEDLVDEPERGPDAHRRAVGLQDLRVPAEDRHPGADRCLGEVDRRDVAVLEGPERLGQLALEAARKPCGSVMPASRGAGGRRGRWRRRGRSCRLRDHPVAELASASATSRRSRSRRAGGPRASSPSRSKRRAVRRRRRPTRPA